MFKYNRSHTLPKIFDGYFHSTSELLLLQILEGFLLALTQENSDWKALASQDGIIFHSNLEKSEVSACLKLNNAFISYLRLVNFICVYIS